MTQAVVFGLGSMFNHSRNPNVGWIRDIKSSVVVYKSLRDIEEGEELCKILFSYLNNLNLILLGISYGDRLTFQDTDPPTPPPESDGTDVLNSINID
jgi:uncharacterized protein